VGGLTAVAPEQLAALEALAPFLGTDYYLVDGVAVALRMHHRRSRDLDLFTEESDPATLDAALTGVPHVRVMQRGPGTLHLLAHGVPVSLLRYPYALLASPEPPASIPVAIASTENLAAMKLSAIGGRGARRDFWDLHVLLTGTGQRLEDALDAFARKYPGVDPGYVVRALVYFGDAEAEPMPEGLTAERWAEVRRDFEHWVRALTSAARDEP
jgi:hypothetical protein